MAESGSVNVDSRARSSYATVTVVVRSLHVTTTDEPAASRRRRAVARCSCRTDEDDPRRTVMRARSCSFDDAIFFPPLVDARQFVPDGMPGVVVTGRHEPQPLPQRRDETVKDERHLVLTHQLFAGDIPSVLGQSFDVRIDGPIPIVSVAGGVFGITRQCSFDDVDEVEG